MMNQILKLQKGTPGRGNYTPTPINVTINGVSTDLHANRHVSSYVKNQLPISRKDLAIMGAGFLPVVGDVIDAYDIGKSLYNKDYTNAAIALGLTLIPGLSYRTYKNAKKVVKATAVSEDLSKVPFYQTLLQHPEYKSMSKPVRRIEADQDVTVMGIIPVGKYKKQYSDEILRRLHNWGYSSDNYFIYKGFPTTPKEVMQDISNTKVNVYIPTDPKPTTGGFFNPVTERSYIRIGPYGAHKHGLIAAHEAIMHGSDELVESVSKGHIPDVYQKLSSKIQPNHAQASSDWYELRATLGEFNIDAYHKLSGTPKKLGETPLFPNQELRREFEKLVDEATPEELAKELEQINAYGRDYADAIRKDPSLAKEFKFLIKYAPMIGTPLILKPNKDE